MQGRSPVGATVVDRVALSVPAPHGKARVRETEPDVGVTPVPGRERHVLAREAELRPPSALLVLDVQVDVLAHPAAHAHAVLIGQCGLWGQVLQSSKCIIARPDPMDLTPWTCLRV